MRLSEFRDRSWKLDQEESGFLNAWKTGSGLFVLTFAAGYEGYGVELQKITSAGIVGVVALGQ